VSPATLCGSPGTPATVLAKSDAPIATAIRRDMRDGEFLDLCEGQSRASSKQRWTHALAKVTQDVQMDQTMRHLLGDFARRGKKGEERYLYMRTDELLIPERRISHLPNSAHRTAPLRMGSTAMGHRAPSNR
jgi:hypothetical protein